MGKEVSTNHHILEHTLDTEDRYAFEERVAIILADEKDPESMEALMRARKIAWRQVCDSRG